MIAEISTKDSRDSGEAVTGYAPMTVVAVRSCDAELLGPEQLILAQAEYYRDTNVRFIIINLSDGTPPVVALHEEALRRGLESVLVQDTGTFNAVTMVPKLGKLLKEYLPDVIHTHGSKAETLSLLARGRVNAALVGSFYGRIAMGPLRWQLFDGASIVTLRAFDRVIANGWAPARELERFRFPGHKVRVVPSSVDATALPERTEKIRAQARREAGLSETEPLVVTMARLHSEKGHKYFLRALPAVREEFPDLRWLIVGDGPLKDEIESEARALGMADAISFFGYRSEGWRLVAAADVVVVPSLREGTSVSLLEAAMLGMPIVATIAGGNPEVILSGQTGLLVPTADSENLAAATMTLLRNPDWAAQLGRGAREMAKSRFGKNAICAQTHEQYRDVVKHASREPS